jgi:hypothetical protein
MGEGRLGESEPEFERTGIMLTFPLALFMLLPSPIIGGFDRIMLPLP